MMWWRRRALEAPTTPLEWLQERASAYIDGELTEAERVAFEAELASSEVARDHVDDLRQVRIALTGIGTVRAPRSFALLAPPVPIRVGPRRLEWATRAGTGVAALLFVVALTNGSSAGDTPVVFTTAQRESASSAAPASKNGSANAAPSGASAGTQAGPQDRAGLAPAAPTSTPIANTTPRPPSPDAGAAGAVTPGAATPGTAPTGTPSAAPAFAPATAPAPGTPASGSASENPPPSAAPATAPATAPAPTDPPPHGAGPVGAGGGMGGATTGSGTIAPSAFGPVGVPTATTGPAGAAPATAPPASPPPRLLGTPSSGATPQAATALATATATVAAFSEAGPAATATGADPFRPDPRDAGPVFARPTPDTGTVVENPMYVPAPTPVAVEAMRAPAPAGTDAAAPSSDWTGGTVAALGALTVLLGGASVAQFAARRRHSR